MWRYWDWPTVKNPLNCQIKILIAFENRPKVLMINAII